MENASQEVHCCTHHVFKVIFSDQLNVLQELPAIWAITREMFHLDMNGKYQEILSGLINRYYILPSEQLQLITEESEIVNFNRNQTITEAGQQNIHEYFILDGIVHRYIIIEKGEFITTGFYVGPAIMTPNFARTSDQRSIFSLQTLVSSVVAQIPVKKLDDLRTSDKHIRKWGQKVVEQELKISFSRETRFRSSNAKERLLHLRREYPSLENSVPHTCIASYVGITPESFSRLRKELSR